METINAKGKMPVCVQLHAGRKNAKWKILIFALCTLHFAIVLSGCVEFQVGGDIQQGRMALMYGDPKVALAHFQRAAELDPNYLLNFSILPQGVWTYVGRAYYDTGKLAEARKALERASARYPDDNLAKIYLGLVLARDGDRQRGLKELAGGLQGFEDWFSYIEQYHPDGRFWDPNRDLRREIQSDLKMIRGKEINWKELIASGEWLGKGFEEEIDRAKRDERMDFLDGESKSDR